MSPQRASASAPDSRDGWRKIQSEKLIATNLLQAWLGLNALTLLVTQVCFGIHSCFSARFPTFSSLGHRYLIHLGSLCHSCLSDASKIFWDTGRALVERYRQQQTAPFCLVLLLNCCMVFDSWTQSWQVIHHPIVSLCSIIIEWTMQPDTAQVR